MARTLPPYQLAAACVARFERSADAIRLISENPYRLARDIRGIGFKSADQIAVSLGIEKTAMAQPSRTIRSLMLSPPT